MCRLVKDGAPFQSVGKAIFSCSVALGRPLKRTPHGRTIGRAVREGYAAGKVQLARELCQAKGTTGPYIMIIQLRLDISIHKQW